MPVSRREVAAQIVEKGGECVLPVEGNQKLLREDVQDSFSDPEVQNEMLSHQDVDGGHWHVETHVATDSHDVGWLQERHDWPGLKAVGRIEAIRERKGKEDQSVCTFIMSAKILPERLLEPARNHRKIENCLHWVLDVVMDEDRMQNRTPGGPECLAATWRIAPDIVRHKNDEHSLKGRMETAAMSDEYLVWLLMNAVGKF